jgi:hypothetical protein
MKVRDLEWLKSDSSEFGIRYWAFPFSGIKYQIFHNRHDGLFYVSCSATDLWVGNIVDFTTAMETGQDDFDNLILSQIIKEDTDSEG